MNKSLFNLAVSVLFVSGVLFTSCQSSGEKVDDAQTKVDAAKQELKDAKQDADAQTIKAANSEEWQLFRAESEKAIRTNEAMIAELKVQKTGASKNLDAVYTKDIATLEEKNKALQNKIDSYDKNRSDWEAFKREFNHDMEELGRALKDLTVNNKK